MRQLFLLSTAIACLTGCNPWTELGGTGQVCVYNEGDEIDWWGSETSTAPALVAGQSTIVVILDSCHSSSVSDEAASCTASIDGSTITVTSEGGYFPPRGSQNDDCHVLFAECVGPDLTDGGWTLNYAGSTIQFDVLSIDRPCLGVTN